MRPAFLLLIASTLASAAVKINPSKPPVVAAGGTIRLNANTPVTWSLAPGSVGSIDPDGTYHAPASVPVKHTVGGCQILGNDHIFNTRIDKLPVDSRSATWMAMIPPSRLNYMPDYGINFADSSTPRKKMHFLYTPQNDGEYEMVPWPKLKRQSGVFTDPHSPLDRHEIAIDHQNCDIYEIYSAYDAGANKDCPTCTAQSGLKYNSLDPALPESSVDAAGLLITPLTLGLEEMREGAVQHALRFTLRNNYIAPQSAWPARSHAGAWGKIPYGTRFRLKPGYDTSSFSPMAKVLLTQLQQYGLMLADGGDNFDISTWTDITEDPDVEAALAELRGKGPRSTDFEIVDESHLMASPVQGVIKQDSELAPPDGFASVIATSKSHNSDVAQVRIVLRGVVVGVPDPAEWIQAGVTTQMKSWVNGTSDQRVRWSMNPALGTITPDGRFSAPTVDHPTTTLFTVASAVDPKSTAKIAVTVMPAGPIRINVGNATRAPGAPNKHYPDYGPDADGNMWWRGQAGEVSWGVVNDDWYGLPWPKTKDISLYYTSRYSLGDMVYSFRVPNGHYNITLMFAQPACKGRFPKGMRAPIHLETQGKIVVPDFDMGAGINDACLSPVVQSIPAEVTDNSLYFALRRVSAGKSTPSPLLNAFSVSKDEEPAHLAVSPAKVASLTINKKIQFKAIGWRMSDNAKWSLVKGPGSITPEGVYSAPAAPGTSDQQIVLKATSMADPSKTATAEMVLKFGDFILAPKQAVVPRSLSTQFAASIDGAPYQSVAWTLEPKLGTIAADGTYTAPDKVVQDTDVKVTAQSKDVPGKAASASIKVQAKPDTIRIDAGSNTGFKDARGNVWSADTGFSQPTMAYTDRKPIGHTTPDMQGLYQSTRYRYSNENFDYNFAVPNGKYAVSLHFADYAFKEAGHYNFDVVIDGKMVLKNFDFDTVYGPGNAVVKRFETAVTNRQLTIDFIGHGGGASIAGIEVEYLGDNLNP
jgi:hypothetical protein